MPTYDYDLFTIGAGSGGVRASRMAAGYGARVAVVEDRHLGGTCVNVGCVPKKLLVYAAHYAEELRDAAGFGWSIDGRSFDWPTLIANKDREIERLQGVYRELLETSGVELIEGRAKVVDPHAVEVGGERITARNILVATGSWPYVPPEITGAEHAITSNEAFYLKRLPERVIVVGGGYIAVEFASIFHGLGARTELVYRRDLFLRGFDDDLRHSLAEEMRAKGITLHFNAQPRRIERTAGGGVAALLGKGPTGASDPSGSAGAPDGNSERLEADQLLCAVGRVPNTAGLGLEEVGVVLRSNGAVIVNDYSRSSLPSIWAVGDVTDRINLTPVAIHEGIALAETLFNDNPTRPDHSCVPTAVFSQPAIGTVGLTEAAARARYDQVDVYRTRFRPLKLSLTENRERVLMKLVVDRRTQRVLGAHMLGPEAGEVIQGIAIAVKMGATKTELDATVGIHPTSAEEFVTMRQPVRSAGQG